MKPDPVIPAEERERLESLRAVLAKCTSSRQRRMVRAAINHVTARLTRRT